MNGGTVDVTRADFTYATEAVTDAGGDSDSNVTIAESSFENENGGVDLTGTSDLTVSLESNTFDLGTSSSSDYAVDVHGDQDLSGIVLSGDNENTFSGSKANIIVAARGNSDIPSESTWDVASSSGAIVDGPSNNAFTVDGTFDLEDNTTMIGGGFPSVQVNGTMDMGSNVIVKATSGNNPIQVNSGGVLDGSGISDDPIIFTSINDDSSGGSVYGSSGSPAVADYGYAIEMNSGTVDITHADFYYATEAVADVGSDSGSSVTISDSSFENENGGVDLTGTSDLTVSMESNTFDLGTSSSSDYAVDVHGDQDLSGIVLSGDDKNTFSGSNANIIVSARGNSDIPSDSTWDVASDSGAIVDGPSNNSFTVDGTFDLGNDTTLIGNGFPSVQVNGTMDMGSNVIVKGTDGGNPVQVNSGGTLDGTGTSDGPIIFTSLNDDDSGGSVYGSSGSPATGDYDYGIYMNGGTLDISYADFYYADDAVTDASGDDGSTVTVSNGTFDNDSIAGYFNTNTQANFADSTISNASTGLEVSGTSKVAFRGSFSDVTGKDITACAWTTATSGDICQVDAAYTDWGSSAGPFNEDSSDDLVCGDVTVSPWVHSDTDYTDSDTYSVPNCDSSATPDSQLATAAGDFESAYDAEETACGDGSEPACTTASEYLTCYDAEVSLVFEAFGDLWSAPDYDPASNATSYASYTTTAASTYVSSAEDNPVTGAIIDFADKVASTTELINNLTLAYNECT